MHLCRLSLFPFSFAWPSAKYTRKGDKKKLKTRTLRQGGYIKTVAKKEKTERRAITKSFAPTTQCSFRKTKKRLDSCESILPHDAQQRVLLTPSSQHTNDVSTTLQYIASAIQWPTSTLSSRAYPLLNTALHHPSSGAALHVLTKKNILTTAPVPHTTDFIHPSRGRPPLHILSTFRSSSPYRCESSTSSS